MQPRPEVIAVDALVELDSRREPLSFLPSHSSCSEHFSPVIPFCKPVPRPYTTGLLYRNLFHLSLIVGRSGGFQYVPVVETWDHASLSTKQRSPAPRRNRSAVEGSVIQERLCPGFQ